MEMRRKGRGKGERKKWWCGEEGKKDMYVYIYTHTRNSLRYSRPLILFFFLQRKITAVMRLRSATGASESVENASRHKGRVEEVKEDSARRGAVCLLGCLFLFVSRPHLPAEVGTSSLSLCVILSFRFGTPLPLSFLHERIDDPFLSLPFKFSSVFFCLFDAPLH
jgi:hypothetical protein